MNELTLDGKTYVSSKRAAEITGYAKDYIGQLCREGRVTAQLVGRNWYILESAIREHRFGGEEQASGGQNQVKSAESRSNPAWNAPRYVPEVPKMIPIAQVQKNIDTMLAEPAGGPETHEAPKPNWNEVHAAWQEWFSRKDAEKATEADVSVEATESEAVALAPEEEMPAIETVTEALETPVVIKAVYEDGEVLDLSAAEARPAMTQMGEDDEPEDEPQQDEEEAEEDIEYRGSPMILRVAFALIAVMIVGITVVASGIATKYYPSIQARVPEINMIAGVSEINR